ncbi:unnamed protein product, partial [Larinioides sclopetarius]
MVHRVVYARTLQCYPFEYLLDCHKLPICCIRIQKFQKETFVHEWLLSLLIIKEILSLYE